MKNESEKVTIEVVGYKFNYDGLLWKKQRFAGVPGTYWYGNGESRFGVCTKDMDALQGRA